MFKNVVLFVELHNIDSTVICYSQGLSVQRVIPSFLRHSIFYIPEILNCDVRLPKGQVGLWGGYLIRSHSLFIKCQHVLSSLSVSQK